MYNVVHIDEKWIYMTIFFGFKPLPSIDEDDSYRTCKYKNFIMKIMLLIAVARPRFAHQCN